MTENPTQPQAQDQVRPQDPTTDDDRLDAVQDRIHDAKAAAADLHDADVVGDLGGAPGTGEDGHGSFEPSGDGTDAGEMTVCKVIEDDAGIDLRVDGDWTPPWQVPHPDEV